MFLAERSGSPLYVLHMAAGSGVESLAEGRTKGLPFYGETLSAYLSWTQEDIWDDSPIEVNGTTYNARGRLYNNYPTPKFPADRETCWNALVDGRLQVVATDHALVSLKDRFETMSTTIDNMQAGQAAVELRIPLLYDQGVNQGRFSVNRWVELISTNPAKIMGMWPQKGQIAEGSDADVVVFDPSKSWTVRWEDLHMSTEYNLWDGWELTGKCATPSSAARCSSTTSSSSAQERRAVRVANAAARGGLGGLRIHVGGGGNTRRHVSAFVRAGLGFAGPARRHLVMFGSRRNR